MITLFKATILTVISFLFINSQLFSQVTVNEHSIKFLNETTATLVGEDGVIQNTIDGGVTWTTQESGVTNVLYGNAIVDENTSFVAGENGLVLKTTDGGATWNILPTGILMNLKKIALINTSVVICGEQGTLLVSHDMGTTWSSPAKFSNSDLNYITVAGQSLITVGANSTVYKSTDDGDTWTQITFGGGSYNFESVAAIDENNFTIAGDACIMTRTTDGGNTWTSPGYEPGNENLLEITFFDVNDGVVVGDHGFVLNTSDAGATWQPSNVEVNPASVAQRNLISVAFSSAANGISIGQFGAHYYTIDGGKNWTMLPANPTNKTGKKKILHAVLNQNYPNPFNPSTVISYNLPFDASVSLNVYDMLGKQVKSLASGFQSAGNYNFRFDGSNLSSGIYFYVLKAAGSNKQFSKTMRMILTK